MVGFVLTDHEADQARIMRQSFPYRIVYVARKAGEETIISAVLSMRIPRQLAREGWEVVTVK